jgi:type II secretory ATPase GspE/PulE/Tfp pilus assembly ATPase PilB-like protein
VLEQADFHDLLLSYPKIGLALTTELAERVESASHQVGIEFINLGRMHFDSRVLGLLPQTIMQQHKVIPVAFINNRLSLAMVNPNNIIALDDIRRIIKGVMIEPVVITEEDFKKFMSTTYHQLMKKEEEAKPGLSAAGVASASPENMMDALQSDMIRDIQVSEDKVASESKQDLMSASEDAPIIRLANSVLGLAIKKGASDIHVEPMEKDVVIRYRIDGVLQTIQNLPKKVQLGLISRLKIISKLDISEKRLPQDGRISVNMESRPIDFRVSTIPGKWGEKVCLRILDKSNTMLGLDKLISHEPTLKLVRELINQPYGIIYVTGLTGSGKTTTLYSALAEINDPGLNISTAEDPIEYDLAGVNQIQANKDIGLDFARILRAFLRQDPDVILVGETRDKETAHIAVEAALTGHLVFTTLHTNSAAGAFTRLNEMNRTVPGIVVHHRRDGAAPGAAPVPALPRRVRRRRRHLRLHGTAARVEVLERPRLRCLRRPRREGPRRNLRSDEDERRVARPGRQRRRQRRTPRRGASPRHARPEEIRRHAAAQRRYQRRRSSAGR